MYDKQDKNSIKELFNSIASRYDILNNVISLYNHKFIKAQAISNLCDIIDKKNLRILDLCCGSGDITELFAKKFPKSEIIGVDFSEKMLEIAREKCKKYSNITFINFDVTNLQNLNCGKFDICFISFGLRNLPSVENFLENIKFVLNQNAIISILDLGKPSGIIGFFYNIYFKKIMPIFSLPVLGNIFPTKYLVNSLKTYPSQYEMLNLLNKFGFTDLKNNNWLFGAISQQMGNLK